ncbi:Fic family protein [Corynebacterium suedekumii]|nr:Fic family protein [Corynebacterium suedekumii]
MHRILLGPSSPDIAGVVRDEPVWIGGSDASPGRALFVPPAAPAVPDLLRDLEAFLSRTDLPVLVHAALAHAQVETIHRFTDGNGKDRPGADPRPPPCTGSDPAHGHFPSPLDC